MKEIRFWIAVVLAVALGVLTWLLNPKIPDSIGSYVLFLTLIAVVWYTRETHKLRDLSARQVELSQEQTELSLRPHLEIVFQRAHFRLHNIGYGPATNIQIDHAIVSISSIPPIRLKFTCPPIVRKDEYQPIEIKIFWAKTDGPALDLSPGIYTPPLATETIKVRVHYENLMGRKYERELVIGKDMPIDIEPVDFLLQYLYENFPKSINPKAIPVLYVKPEDRMKLIQYCDEKGLTDADPIRTDQEGIVEYLNLRINAEGIDYLKRKG
jgi:hypothetical protein